MTRWVYRIVSLIAVGLALAPLLPLALRVVLLLGAVALAVVDALPRKAVKRRAVVVPKARSDIPLYDQYEIKPPEPFPPTLGAGMFSAPRMRV